MSVTYHTLASGSAGNSALVRAGDTGVLIDIGMDERLIAHRLAASRRLPPAPARPVG